MPENQHANASAAYNARGGLIDGHWHNYPERAAAGLWTTPTDLATYCIQIQEILAGKTEGVLSPATVLQMLTKDQHGYGLGPALVGDGDGLIFQHGGKNAGFTNHMMAYAHRGDAIVVMTNADGAGGLIDEVVRSIAGFYDWDVGGETVLELVEGDSEVASGVDGALPSVHEWK